MANTDRAFGARPIGSLGDGSWDGMANRYFIPSTDSTVVAIGDFVKIAGSADSAGVPTIAKAAAGDALVGVVVGFEPDVNDLSLDYRKASTNRYALVVDDHTALFVMQEDGDGGGAGAALAATDVGNNVNFVVGTVTPVGGVATSNNEIDSSTKATTATLPLKLVRLLPRVDNEIGNFARWVVSINNHQYGSHTGTAGV